MNHKLHFRFSLILPPAVLWLPPTPPTMQPRLGASWPALSAPRRNCDLAKDMLDTGLALACASANTSCKISFLLFFLPLSSFSFLSFASYSYFAILPYDVGLSYPHSSLGCVTSHFPLLSSASLPLFPRLLASPSSPSPPRSNEPASRATKHSCAAVLQREHSDTLPAQASRPIPTASPCPPPFFTSPVLA